MDRRGFLKAAVAIAAAPLVLKAAELIPAPAANPVFAGGEIMIDGIRIISGDGPAPFPSKSKHVKPVNLRGEDCYVLIVHPAAFAELRKAHG